MKQEVNTGVDGHIQTDNSLKTSIFEYTMN